MCFRETLPSGCVSWFGKSASDLKFRYCEGVVSKDHVHILVSTPPDISPADIMRRVKGRVSRKIFRGISSHQESVLGLKGNCSPGTRFSSIFTGHPKRDLL